MCKKSCKSCKIFHHDICSKLPEIGLTQGFSCCILGFLTVEKRTKTQQEVLCFTKIAILNIYINNTNKYTLMEFKCESNNSETPNFEQNK